MASHWSSSPLFQVIHGLREKHHTVEWHVTPPVAGGKVCATADSIYCILDGSRRQADATSEQPYRIPSRSRTKLSVSPINRSVTSPVATYRLCVVKDPKCLSAMTYPVVRHLIGVIDVSTLEELGHGLPIRTRCHRRVLVRLLCLGLRHLRCCGLRCLCCLRCLQCPTYGATPVLAASPFTSAAPSPLAAGAAALSFSSSSSFRCSC